MYVFDTSSFIRVSHYYMDRFPTFWENVASYVSDGKLVSVREVHKELINTSDERAFDEWVKKNKPIFKPATGEETSFLSLLFATKNFRDNLNKRHIQQGMPVADPFLVAYAKVHGATVVTEERYRPNAAKIPNMCDHFGIPCKTLLGFMTDEDWVF